MKTWVRMSCSMLVLLACSTRVAHSAPLGPGFSYQGELVLNGTPVNGPTTLIFSLWDAPGAGSPPSGGNQIGTTQYAINVAVTNGLFVVQLNNANEFGASAFSGDARWLEVVVCADPMCSLPTVLSPRQPLLATPYTQFAAGPWRVQGGNAYFTNGNVGIGTSTPNEKLTIAGDMELGTNVSDYHHFRIGGGNCSGFLYGSYPALGDGIHMGYNYYADPSGSGVIPAHDGQTSRVSMGYGYVALATGGTDTPPTNRLFVATNGNVGIGTDFPTNTLSVNGEIALGPGAVYSATSGEENLRLMRGNIGPDGVPTTGCCFSVGHSSPGEYVITFYNPFASTPSVTASCYNFPGKDPSCHVIQPTANGVTIEVTDRNGTLFNWGFNLIVTGPR